MTRKELTSFYKQHPLAQFSAARLEYSVYYHPEALEMAKETFQYVANDVDVIMEAQIEGADRDALLRLMRKRISGDNKLLLRSKLLEREEEMLPLIQRRCMTSVQDLFIENALNFLLHTKTDPVNWIMDHYREFRSEYLRSMLCLVLGIRGDDSLLPFLMEETVRMETQYKEELFSQGPLLAVHELGLRYLDMDD